MNDTQIKSFIALSKIGSFSKAETILCITKTALKKQMDSMEDELGFPLFVRTSAGLKLTQTGQVFLEEIRQLYLDYSTLVHKCKALHQASRYTIRIGEYSVSTMQNWYMAVEKNSDLKIEHVYISGEHITHEANMQLLKNKTIDFLEYEDNHLIYFENLRFRKISEDYLCCIMRNDHPLAERESIHPADLSGYKVYCWTSDSSATRALMSYARQLNIQLETNEYNVNNVLKLCNQGSIYILSNTLSNIFRPLKIIPIVPKIPYYRGLVYTPENEELIDRMIAAADPKQINFQESFPLPEKN